MFVVATWGFSPVLCFLRRVPFWWLLFICCLSLSSPHLSPTPSLFSGVVGSMGSSQFRWIGPVLGPYYSDSSLGFHFSPCAVNCLRRSFPMELIVAFSEPQCIGRLQLLTARKMPICQGFWQGHKSPDKFPTTYDRETPRITWYGWHQELCGNQGFCPSHKTLIPDFYWVGK